jgi:hypothetical protein
MGVGSGSPAPLKKVQRVQFGIFSPDELVSIDITRKMFL